MRPRGAVSRLGVRLGPWLATAAALRRYALLDEARLRATRRSDSIFVFGSGGSINDLGPEECAHFEEHDTLGFNWFVHQRIVRMDYHLIRGIPDTDLDRAVWKPQFHEYFRLIRENPRYADTVYLVQSGFRAINGNRALGYGYLPSGSRVFRWTTNDVAVEPSRSFAAGLVHSNSTLEECVNFAYLLGWRRIVLVGVDLYDRRYFWLDPGETRSIDVRRDASVEQTHSRASSGMVDLLGRWAELFSAEGVELYAYNARSLLAGTLPVYAR